MALKLLAPLRTWEKRRSLRAARDRADAELLGTRLAPPRLAWRTAELLAEENRVDLSRSLTDVVRAADERLLPSASPLDRTTVRAVRAPLLDLAARLADPSRHATPRGILLVERLLVDGSGPLYGRTSAVRLRDELQRIAAALDGADVASS